MKLLIAIAASLTVLPCVVFLQDSSAPIHPITYEGLKEVIKGDSGRVVLVNAWASWCQPCQQEMPALVKLQHDLSPRGFQLVLIAIDDTEIIQSTLRPLAKKRGVTFPSYILTGTSDEAFIDSMNPSWSGALPASFVYDKSGKMRQMLVGRRSYVQFRAALRRVL